MEYYLFKATSKELNIEREYIYNLAIGEKDSIYKPMVETVKSCIFMDLEYNGFDPSKFKFTKSIIKSKYITRNLGKFKLIEPVETAGGSISFPKAVNEKLYDRATLINSLPSKGYRDRYEQIDKFDGKQLPLNSKWRDIPSKD